MKLKRVLKIEILILIILFAMFILSVFYAYMTLRKSENIISSASSPVGKNSNQKYNLTCSQIDKAVFDKISKKYLVTLGSNSSNAAWSIQNNLNCSPTGGSGSVFTTKCANIGQSKATASYGELQITCDFSTVP